MARDNSQAVTVNIGDRRVHATRAQIDLDAISANAAAIVRHVRPATLLAVVKANAYGHGAVAAAKSALDAGATWLGVYKVQEGVQLRAAGIAAPILVFGPFDEQEAGVLRRSRLTATITSLKAVETLDSVRGDRLPVHVKVDTGLNRSGLAPSEVILAAQAIARSESLTMQGLYTHFARADETDLRSAENQLACFAQTSRRLEEAGFRVSIKHAANSAGLLNLPASHLDMVRAGIALYGYYPSDESAHDIPLHPALELYSRIVRLHRIPTGGGVGYGHEFRCERETNIALVPLGYGDGLPRNLGNGRGGVLIRGRSAPIVGRVSMDQITVDVTEIPGVSTGDLVTLIGENEGASQTADDVATAAGTISYEILTRLMPRIPRLYCRGGRPVEMMDLSSAGMLHPVVEE